jgi:hypothetical protein
MKLLTLSSGQFCLPAAASPPACPEGLTENLWHLCNPWFKLHLTGSQRDLNPA